MNHSSIDLDESYKLAIKLIDIVVGASRPEVGLSALLGAYISLSITHPSLAYVAANAALEASMQLSVESAQSP
jgi:hypothetical protein